MNVLHCFAMRIYSKHRKTKLKLIQEDLELSK